MKSKEFVYISVKLGRLHMELRGAGAPPNRDWDRDADNRGVYYRFLTAPEAVDLLGSGASPVDIAGLRLEMMRGARSIEVYPNQRVAVVVADLKAGEIFLSPELRDPLTIDAPGLVISAEQVVEGDHLVRDGVLHSFEGESCRGLFSILKGQQNKGKAYCVAYRLLSEIRIMLAKIGIPLIEKFHREDVLRVLEADFRKTKLAKPIRLGIKLYEYQEEALRWMQFCHAHQLGCLLGDEMGLGKTASAISLLATNGDSDGPNLVVCPVTLLENWSREISRVNPSAVVRIHYGSSRFASSVAMKRENIVLTSYGMLRRDIHLFGTVDWNIIILDEAQKIKNPDSSISRACRQLRARCPVATTGTPFENRPLDLWSIMDFIQPGYLGSREDFEIHFAGQISSGSKVAAALLKDTVGLFMMRRLKSEVQRELPPKIVREHPLVMTRSEGEAYISRLSEIRRKAAAGRGGPGAGFMELRQFCCHPAVVEGVIPEDPTTSSAKYRALVDLLEKTIEAGEKSLVFAPFVRMLDIFEVDLARRFGVPIFRIDGQVDIAQRQNIVDHFAAVSGPAIMILNPQAGGVGLNIVAANHVIHYCREWNPAVEDQASDRAHRIGQTRTVMVHCLYYVQTIDEVVATRLGAKRSLANALVTATTDKDLDRAAITEILKLEPKRLLPEGDDADPDQDFILE